MRVLITGSRTWTNIERIRDALIAVDTLSRHRAVLVSGACPKGADAMCEAVAEELGWVVERHPAEWVIDGKYDQTAGFKRNAEMVKRGANICVAFIKDGSKGASHTARLAAEAGIPTVRYEE